MTTALRAGGMAGRSEGQPHKGRRPELTRRRLLCAGGALVAPQLWREAAAHDALGPIVPPQAVPDFRVVCQDGRRTSFAQLLRGRATALQFMFTGCSATCPLQGAIFGAAQQLLAPSIKSASATGVTSTSGAGAAGTAGNNASAGTGSAARTDVSTASTNGSAASASRLQFVSLSIDPLADDPRALAGWLARYDAGARWIACAPEPAALAQVRSMFTDPRNPADNHGTQVFMIDANLRLVFRTEDLPAPKDIARLLSQLSQFAG